MRWCSRARAQGLPSFTIVGLPDASVNEAKERVRAAVKNSGMVFPIKRITVNLAPADLRKEGPSYDLPMAVGILRASEQVVFDDAGYLFLGELGLDGTLRHTNGILPMVAIARERGVRTVFVPAIDAAEAALVDGIVVIPVETLAALAATPAWRHPTGPGPAHAVQRRRGPARRPGSGGCARPGARQARPGGGRRRLAQHPYVTKTNAHGDGHPFSLSVAFPVAAESKEARVLDALRALHAEQGRPTSVAALARSTRTRTGSVITHIEALVAAGLARRLGRGGKGGIVPAE